MLIVGAGPTGLMMACQLAMRNISFRIIDRSSGNTKRTRALIITARTLEIFQQMGIADEAMRQGKIAKGINVIADGKKSLRFDLKQIGKGLTDFPFLLILEESKTEALLTQFLNRYNTTIERNKELLCFSQNKKNVRATVKDENGEEEMVAAGWLIGADGTHSRVREQLNISFSGRTYKQSLFAFDCEIDLHFPPDETYLTISEETFVAFFPMINGKCRVIGLVPPEKEQKKILTFEDINGPIVKRTRLKIKIQNSEGISKFLAHQRVANSFRKGRCFLAGDSAHTHSPFGAQGMNTGLQDACNLAWKLALVIRGKADEQLLSTYHKERYEIAKRLMKTTDKSFNAISSRKKILKFFVSKIIPPALKILLPVAQKCPFISRPAFKKISNIDINYRESRLSKDYDLNSFNKIPLKSGDRVPCNWLRKRFTEGISFHLLIFSKNGSGTDELEEICKPYSNLIKVCMIPLNANTERIYRQFGIKESGYYLIRPDSYIAFRSQTLEHRTLQNYLSLSLKLKCVQVFLTGSARRYLSVFS